MLSRWMTRRRLLRMPPTEIGRAPRRGLIRIVGTVAAEPSYRTPVLRVPCAAFVTEIIEYASGPSVLLRLASPGPLHIDDPTGRAQIAAEHRDLNLVANTYKGHFDEAREGIERVLAEFSISTRTATGSVRGISFVEHVLRPGDTVTAVGFARQVVTRHGRGGAEAGYRKLLTQLELEAEPGAAVLVSDDPRSTGETHVW